MISVIVYGRNDTHGYNLHRRAALSLNCLAEVLSDPDDEIVFVDYNTPDELPTLVEALSDTLTERCLERLRVLRVPASIHEQRFAARTHLPAVEPVARNAGARRANPSNRWLLSTNTDMILLPLSDRSLSEICSDLADGFYGLPRFELPEWLWERLRRSDPHGAMAEIRRLGRELRLDEPTVSHEWIRFDAPGDFQLLLREDFFDIDGFDEEMLLGWHVDSNLSRRMFLRQGSIGSLEDHVAGYHCNHSRMPTVYHGEKWIANDWGRFFFSVDRSQLPDQRDTWGLADVELEEIRVREHVGPLLTATIVAATSSNGPAKRRRSDALEAKFELTYDSGHVLAFIVDSLMVSPHTTRVAYVGANPVLADMLANAVAGMGLEDGLTVADLDDDECAREVSQTADLFVVDLGIDATLLDASRAPGSSPYKEARARLLATFEVFQIIVALERERLLRGEHPRRFVLVNSVAAYWNAYVLAQLDCSPSTFHSRVRRALVRTLQDEQATQQALEGGHRLLRWSTRHDAGRASPLPLRCGETVELLNLKDFGAFGAGWTHPDATAIWTQGARSELSIAPVVPDGSKYVLDLLVAKVGARVGEALKVKLTINGIHAATRVFTKSHPDPLWRVPLPSEAVSSGTVKLTLEFEKPPSWSSDDRQLGLYLRSLTIRRDDWRERARAGGATWLTRLRAANSSLREKASTLRKQAGRLHQA